MEAVQLAALEQGVNAASWLLGRLPETRPLASVLNSRSVGVKDLRFGSCVEEDWRDQHVLLGGAVFLQVNRGTAQLLEAHVIERVGPQAGMRLIDAYCGVALHARRAARAGAEVAGIELDAHAVADARRALPDSEIAAAPVEEALPGMLPADVVIVNPPRAGLAPEAIGYVSAHGTATDRGDIAETKATFECTRAFRAHRSETLRRCPGNTRRRSGFLSWRYWLRW